MWLVCGNPTVNLGAVLVLDNQFCAGKFFVGGDVYLGNFHLDGIIKHFKGLHLTVGQHLKLHALRNGITVRGSHLGQSILASRQPFHVVRCIGRNPAVNFVAFFIGKRKFCAVKFFLGGKVFLGNLHLGNIILHNNGGIVQQFPVIPLPEQNVLGGQIVNLALLQRIAALVSFLNQAERNIIGQCVPIGGADLRQCVRFTEMQPGHAMRFIGGHPCGYDVAIHVLDSKCSAGQFFIVGKVALAYPHFRRLIGTSVIQHHDSLSVIGKSNLHRLLVDIIAERGAEFLDDVITAVGGGVLADAAAVILAANGNIAVKIGVAVCAGFGAGGDQFARCKQQFAVNAVNIISRVQVEYCTGKVFAGFAVNLVNADFGFFAVIVEFQGLLLGEIGVGILAAHDLKTLGRCSAIIFGNARGHNHIVQLGIPNESDIIAVRSADIAVRRFGFLDMVAAQRQGHADFANRAVMDYRQEIVGGLSAGRGKGGNIRAAVAGSDYGDYIALGIPERAVAIIVGLPILRINILGGCDGILRTGQRAGFIHEIAVFGFTGHPRVKCARFCFPAS